MNYNMSIMKHRELRKRRERRKLAEPVNGEGKNGTRH